jgi:hypothetical protein
LHLKKHPSSDYNQVRVIWKSPHLYISFSLSLSRIFNVTANLTMPRFRSSPFHSNHFLAYLTPSILSSSLQLSNESRLLTELVKPTRPNQQGLCQVGNLLPSVINYLTVRLYDNWLDRPKIIVSLSSTPTEQLIPFR